MIGKIIAHYEVLEKLGEGGMGVVYKARDTHLNRSIALKVLPPEKVADPERKRRFVQEAQSASALNHPNIIHIYDIDQRDGVDYIAMEYVEGKTLGELIGRKGLKLGEALKYGVQITDALSGAHAAGIIHRDLKPGNIMVDERGSVKVLDFGLAKLTETLPLGEDAPTRTMRPATEEGTILGTVSYMSPEQAEGKPLDTRSDIFSFGAVLYEMLTGNRAFQNDSKTSTLAAILTQEPAPLGGEIPHDVERVVARCLRKDVSRRYQHMDDVKATLAELKEESESGKLKAPARAPARVSRLVLVLAFLAVATAGVVVWRLTRPATPPAAPVLTRLTFDSGLTTDPALSPDGKLLAYASDRAGEGNLDIWVKQVGGGEPVRVTRDTADEREPAFSPDGTTIAFRSEGKEDGVYVVSALGGSPRKIAPGGREPSFSPAGDLVAYRTGAAITTGSAHFGTGGHQRAYIVPSAGGAARQIQPRFAAVLFPDWAPDGKHLLFLGKPDEASDAEASVDWWVTPVEGGTAVRTGITDAVRKAGLTGPSQIYPWMLVSPAWEPDGGAVIFSARSGDTTNLWRFGITPKTWQVTGPPARLTSGTTVEESPAAAVGTGGAVRVAFANLNLNSDIWAFEMDWVQGRLRSQPRPLIADAADDSSPHLSADGKKIVFLSTRSGSQQVWIRDFETGMDTALTAIRSQKITVGLSPDASKVSFSSLEDNKWNIYVVPSTGGVQELICSDCGHITDWSPDGNWAFYNDVRGRAGVIETGSRRKIELFVQPGKFVCCGGFSPDGRWLAFFANSLVYAVRFQTERAIAEAAWGEALGTASEVPRWGPRGDWLLLWRRGSLWAQRLDPATKRPVGAPVVIYESQRAPESKASEAGPPSRPGPDTVVFSRQHRSGNIWMVEFTP